LYAENEISIPLASYGLTTESTIDATAVRYVISDPSLIRVSFANRMSTGAYTLLINKNECTSARDACILEPGHPLDKALPATPLNIEDTAWYELNLQPPTRPDSEQFMRAYARRYIGDSLALSLVAEDGITPVYNGSLQGIDDPDFAGFLLSAQSRQTGLAERLYLKVTRTDLSLQSYTVGWETDLTVFYGQSSGVPGSNWLHAHCVETTDEDIFDDNADEIEELRITVDGLRLPDVPINLEVEDGAGGNINLEGLGSIGFIDSLILEFREEDDGDDDFIRWEIQALPLDDWPIPAGEPPRPETLRWRNPDDEDEIWDLYFNLGRSVPPG
jgi:hypothetical protein